MARANEDPSMSSWKRTCKFPLSDMARWPSQKPPTPTCHDMTRHANVITWHDMYHFISFHPLPSGSFQVCQSSWWLLTRPEFLRMFRPRVNSGSSTRSKSSRTIVGWPYPHVWWFGTFGLFFHHIGNVIIPTDFHIFQTGRSTTNQYHY